MARREWRPGNELSVALLGAQFAILPGDAAAGQRDARRAGAGDAFVGGFAAALAGGADPLEAARFGSATAGISMTRAGTAPAMPRRAEIEALLQK